MELDYKHSISQIKIIYFALLIGQIIFFAVSYYLQYSGSIEPEVIPYFKEIVLLVVLFVVILSYLLPFMMIKKMNTNSSLSDKLNEFRSSFILRMALLEGSNLLLIVYYLLSGNKNALILIAFVFVIEVFHFPSKQYIIKILKLSTEEENAFSD